MAIKAIFQPSARELKLLEDLAAEVKAIEDAHWEGYRNHLKTEQGMNDEQADAHIASLKSSQSRRRALKRTAKKVVKKPTANKAVKPKGKLPSKPKKPKKPSRPK
ncbi:hypothetical protein [Dongia rigui]|uniref:Uncharacterized protein n=1 Tax=Dongia rigui TaxID=940149 RepID=A0ABU5DZ97_9PROT|nr:hypothetical protein [Dongia rigui]MDY0872654.1 hypothetical protein [Dongia rigui]